MRPKKLSMILAMKRFAHLFYVPALAFLMLGAAPAAVPAEKDVFETDTGYRISRYRAPTPETVEGGTRIDIDEFDRLVRDERAVVIDVMVAEGAGPHPKTGAWRLSKPRRSIPGAVWLADVGKGQLSAELHTYFVHHLDRLSGGDKTRPIIIFCLADCWMSWNAVKRAASFGYTRLYWYPEGTDGWRDWDRPLVVATPEPLERVQIADASGASAKISASPLPQGKKTVTLVSAGGERLDVATVTFVPGESASNVKFSLKLIDAPFREEFLSMRPFRCLPDKEEMWCHLAYPYASKLEIAVDDLQDLEYALLFLFKPPKGYGIDAWNGLYFKLELQPGGNLKGQLHETDMNVLAVPPEPGVLRPISHDALTLVEPDAHRFHLVEIR